MNRFRLPMFALLGLLCALPLRLESLPVLALLFPSWLAWLLAGTGAGVVTAAFSRPAHGWNWLWRPVVTGLGYTVVTLILAGFLTPFVSFFARLVIPPAASKTIPVVVASFSGSTVHDGIDVVLYLLRPAGIVFLIGAAFTVLPRLLTGPHGTRPA